MQQVSDLQLFKQMRAQLLEELEMTKNTIAFNEKKHKTQFEELEKKFLAAREKLEKDAAARIAHSRQVYKEEVGKELDMESKFVRAENLRMSKELKFHEETTSNLQKQNVKIQQEFAQLKLDISLLQQRDEEHSKRSLKLKKLVSEKDQKLQTLERCLAQTIHDFEAEMKGVQEARKKEVEELHRELALAKEAVGVKEKHLKGFRKYSSQLIRQRNDIEQFFLDALEQVKDEIRQKREEEFKHAKIVYAKTLRDLSTGVKFPHIKAQDPRLQPPVPPSSSLDIKDLSHEDRDKVLRLLFARINNQPIATGATLPPHSFSIQIDASNISSDSRNHQAFNSSQARSDVNQGMGVGYNDYQAPALLYSESFGNTHGSLDSSISGVSANRGASHESNTSSQVGNTFFITDMDEGGDSDHESSTTHQDRNEPRSYRGDHHSIPIHSQINQNTNNSSNGEATKVEFSQLKEDSSSLESNISTSKLDAVDSGHSQQSSIVAADSSSIYSDELL
jgi:hypothetical protein